MATSLSYGILVAIEGIDGAGKTTQAELLCARLQRDGYAVRRTKEPTTGPWGQRIRESASTTRLDAVEELNAFIEDRRQHVRELIRPSLGSGHIVIVDRYYFSTAAYQGARGHDPDEIIKANETFAPKPDLLVILDIPPSVGRQRISIRGDVANLFEDEAALAESASIFDKISGPGVLHIDGLRSIDDVANEIAIAVYDGPLAQRLAAEQRPRSTLTEAAKTSVIETLNSIADNKDTTWDEKIALVIAEAEKLKL